ncbi:MAG TPA: hypothetical protein VH139_06920 [Acidobacteriaceae bacterium]|jgi:hypothetical protein|nr:hypothetical protein [Acidobacteriaceae bacterium]
MASDRAISRWRRAGFAALSGLTGWLVGQLVCLPVNLIIAVRDSEGDAKLFVQTLLYGLLAWGGWTMLLAATAWFLVVLPLVITMRPCLVVRLRWYVPMVAAVAALSLVGTRPTMFRDRSAITFFHRYAQVIPYGAFAVSFTLVTAWMYILLCKRRLDRAESPG